ncbi:MAG: dodecin family protein [Bacillota bacterium]
MTTVKVLEMVAESHVGFEDAIKNAVADAAKRVNGVTGIEVYNMTADVDNGKIVDYKVNLKVAFVEK